MIEQTTFNNPYKALRPYEEVDEKSFLGRESEKKNLFALVKNNFLTVVFGKSGIGKTSLLNAGLCPGIRAHNFLPISIRLQYSDQLNLVDQIKKAIQDELKTHRMREIEREKQVEKKNLLNVDRTLWEYFQEVTLFDGDGEDSITPVLILDQFEEIFTIGNNHKGINELKYELYCLIENQMPDSFKEKIANKKAVFPHRFYSPRLRVIISLREDYLPHLNTIKPLIPSIDKVLLRVVFLNGKHAREIINMPQGIPDVEVADYILRRFHTKETGNIKTFQEEELEVEPSILSLLCYQNHL